MSRRLVARVASAFVFCPVSSRPRQRNVFCSARGDLETRNMSDLEQKCEEALFVLCDARERYPTKCAEEFGNCIRLTSEICMTPCAKSTVDVAPIITAFTAEQNEFLEAGLAKRGPSLASLDERVQKMLDQINNLKEVMEQVKRDRADTRFTYI